jgi:DNA repair exonuclease SbcCD ATPase subunit
MVRKDSLGSTVSPTTAKAEPSYEILYSNMQRHYEEWKSCKGRPDEFMQKELRVAEENLESLQKNIPKIELAVKDTQQQHTEAQEELKRMEVFQEELDASAAKARLSQGRHKDIKDQWYMESRKHVQVAWEENNRCSKAWQKAVNDRAEAQRIEMEAKQKIEKIQEERKQLEKFGGYLSSLHSSNGA